MSEFTPIGEKAFEIVRSGDKSYSAYKKLQALSVKAGAGTDSWREVAAAIEAFVVQGGSKIPSLEEIKQVLAARPGNPKQ